MRKILFILFILGCENTITDTNSQSHTTDNGIVINEINYNSSLNLDSEDWVELYNPTSESIEISLWEFRDEGNIFIIPENVILNPGDYLVLCKDLNMFTNQFPNISNTIGDFDFGLNGGGERIRLFDINGLLIDEVEYDDNSPWPIEADGYGPTLELIDAFLDNTIAENWNTSNINGGTPGTINSIIE